MPRTQESADSRPTGKGAGQTIDLAVPLDHSRGPSWRDRLAPRRLSGLYLLVVLIIVYSLTVPGFASSTTFKLVVSSQVINGVLTLGLVFSLISGVFDISIGANMSYAMGFVAWLQAYHHVNAAVAVVLTTLLGALVGAVNAIIITRFKVSPVVATLGMTGVLEALNDMLVQGNTIAVGLSPSFSTVANKPVLGLPIAVFYLLALAIVLWFALEHTPWGRYLRAAGSNPVATRLSGINVIRLQWSALILSGVLGAWAGILLTMQSGAASFEAGIPYLLPAFAAAFLGATQIQPGRFNIWGTIIALLLLKTAVQGLQLKFPSNTWLEDMVQGAVLIVAVGISNLALSRKKT